ncbi:voltage-dependent calcium channel subunit alpha-2/delta-4-like [Anticarsia gemmatalis]|uniref:voltage-dependent calcium channel subunit alpha-2/delta-4-like n=1 Tax=Anticarsia gemmatalis TaxID=129554 RepID=UPI003F768077
MNTRLLFLIIILLPLSNCVKTKPKNATSIADEKKKILDREEALSKKGPTNKSEVKPVKITNVVVPKVHPVAATTAKTPPVMIPPDVIQEWARQISDNFFEIDNRVVRRRELRESFTDVKSKERNGTAIVNQMADALEELLARRAHAAEEIMRKAEELAKSEPPAGYTFDRSVELDQIKKKIAERDLEDYELGAYCRSLRKLQLTERKHFDARVSLDATSVHVALEVFDCNPKVVEHLYWSEGLLPVFQKNYAQDSSIDFQYFCSAQGFLRHYPAALWDDMFKLKLSPDDAADVYDCRLRPWYVSAGGAPRDVLILLDASGSMHNSSNKLTAEQFTLALLSALTDDDRVNVLRFNVIVQSPISCFNDKLVSANHVNTAAMMAALKMYKMTNETAMADVLTYAVGLLKEQRKAKDRPQACQQAIVLLTDSLYENFTGLMRELDKEGSIRLFTLWLHDQFGLRDHTRSYGEYLSCDRDGYFAEMITQNDVTQQVYKILQVMERPLVGQRKNRLTVFSDVIAHVEDPRRSEFYWQTKENTEQANRYKELMRHKERLLSSERLLKDHMRQVELDEYGYYYEGQDLNYRLQISVAVPVFDNITSENITIKLDEEKQRNATRTYPVNRLLGVAGVDIPIDHLKLRLPYHQIGAGGSLFLIDHRGNVVIHDNLKPTFDGDILKPGYRTVDFIDVEQAAEIHEPRGYPKEWVKFRKKLIIDKEAGNRTMYAKTIFEDGMRAILEMREYHWKRILNHYTAVVVLPLYNRYHKVPEAVFTKELAQEALKSQTDFVIQPDWLYCRHIEPHFDTREAEVRHFIRRRSDEPNFVMQKLDHFFSAFKPTLLEKNYMCNEELMARLCKEIIATEKWAREHEKPGTDHDCTTCKLGSVTAFFATENGLTRWQQYHATSAHAPPPNASWWSRGPAEPYYRRAAAASDLLVVHAPVSPIRGLRISEERPPAFGIRSEWYTAAQVLGSAKDGIIGVAGFHFHPHHLKNLVSSVTNFPTDEDTTPRCDGVVWSCVLIDEYGWVLAHDGNNYTEPPEDPLREHLSTLHPTAMAALVNASVFEINWLHDYQGVCFPPKDEDLSAASTIVPSILLTIWRAVDLVFRITREMVLLITIISSSSVVSADTAFEKQKRRKRLWRDFQREKYERLYDDRVLVNRTRFAACDRQRPIYILQDTPKAKAALRRSPKPCTWPLVAAPVPHTNLLLIAVFNACPYKGEGLPDPLINKMFLRTDEEMPGMRQSSAGKLACWRNRQHLPARPPHVRCYPHQYHKESGYRQCGPWLPDPEHEEDGAAVLKISKSILVIVTILFAIEYFLPI